MLSNKQQNNIKLILDRKPTREELAVYDAMWSEHCSYKSSKPLLKHLYTKNKHVIHGPGENAGVIDIGDGDKIAFKVESHNHPSYIEPFQGAATGVGGILRDVFTMGFRPIACLNSLHFGSPNLTCNRKILDGVISGLSYYGNCVGVPTVASEMIFADCYEKNPIVNAMAVGHTDKKVFTSKPSNLGSSYYKGSLYYVGAKTGRDGIGGAMMASEQFTGDEGIKRPTVQVGDPYLEKLLIEASLELFETGAVIAAQDMGAAGLTSSTTEIAIKGNVGVQIFISKIPLREENMEPWEILISESQERMLFVLDDTKVNEDVLNIFKKWDLEFVKIGNLTNSKRFEVIKNAKSYCDIPLYSLSIENVVYSDKRKTKKAHVPYLENELKIDRYKYKQMFDEDVQGNTCEGIHENVAIVQIPNKNKAIGMSIRNNPFGCYENPYEGIRRCISDAYNELMEYDVQPIAMTNCLNFGNPEIPEIMYEFSQTIQGMKNVCESLDLPVVSGNVSFYNSTEGIYYDNIMPTPVVGLVGLYKGKNYGL
jgi:phosphoribosylformylglycinamidine synthase subunit PurL